jgi:hypothetical protein
LRRRGAAPPRLRARRRCVVLPPVINRTPAHRPPPPVSQASLGMIVHAQRRAGWALVETRRYRGWVRSAALRHDRRLAPLLEVVSLFSYVHAVRDVTARAPIAVVPILARLERAGGGGHGARGQAAPSGDWMHVRLPDDRLGWVQSADLRPAEREGGGGWGVRPEAVLATALRPWAFLILWGHPRSASTAPGSSVGPSDPGLQPRDADLQYADRRQPQEAARAARRGPGLLRAERHRQTPRRPASESGRS